ncbi:MAG: radical SAM/SPASM domain-containing protein [Kiritimatiellia bacterium]
MAKQLVRLLRVFAAYQRRQEVLGYLPIRLWVESASACNLRCPMCLNKDMPLTEKNVMPYELFVKIVDEARGFVNDMYLHHRGEPLLNRRLPEMIAYAEKAGIKTRFHTNGALLDEQRSRALLAAGPHLVSFSVDGFEKKAYEEIRRGAVFEETVENILRFVQIRRSAGLRRPYVVVERIRFRDSARRENPQAVATLTRRFLDSGVDEVIVKEEYVWATEDALEVAGPPVAKACTFAWYAMVICADGTVTACPQDFRARMSLGKVQDATLVEIWNGPAYRDLRKRLATALDSLPLCRKCDRLQRKTVGGVPFQYLIPFLVDQLVGYNRLRRLIGSRERN